MLLRNAGTSTSNALFRVAVASSIPELSCNVTVNSAVIDPASNISGTPYLAPGGLLLCSGIHVVTEAELNQTRPSQSLTLTATTGNLLFNSTANSNVLRPVYAYSLTVSFPSPVSAAPAIGAQLRGLNCTVREPITSKLFSPQCKHVWSALS